jgi:hypothetical protein
MRVRKRDIKRDGRRERRRDEWSRTDMDVREILGWERG